MDAYRLKLLLPLAKESEGLLEQQQRQEGGDLLDLASTSLMVPVP